MKPSFKIGVGGMQITPLHKRLVNQVLDSGRLSQGPVTKKFESQFASRHQCRFAVFTNSGTSSLHIALAALKEKYRWADDDEILVPAVTFVATSNIVLHNRMKPVFVDVDSKTYNMDPSRIEERITRRTRAIIPVHLCGLPCDMTAVMMVARRHGLKVIEDSCETMFARCQGRSVGSFGQIGCFSTYIAHLLVTGVGGLTLTNDPEIATMLRSLANHGRNAIYIRMDDDRGLKGKKLHEIVDSRFSFIRLGHSFRATEMEAALGLAELELASERLKKRRNNALLLLRELAPFRDRLQLPYIPEDRDHNFMMFPLVLRKEDKTRLVRFLEEHSVETRDLLPLLTQPFYIKEFGPLIHQYPVAQWLARGGFYIGCHPYMRPGDLEYIVDQFRLFFKKN